jgi:hypothetical protein
VQAKVDGLVGDFDALGKPPANGRFSTCFFDSDPIVAHLQYANGRSVTIFVPMSSCFLAANGDITRSSGHKARTRLRAELIDLTAG